MFIIANPERLLSFPKPEEDGYKGGACPACGEFACGTWRTPTAPVFCRNGHRWMRGSNSLWGIEPPQPLKQEHAPLAHPFWGC